MSDHPPAPQPPWEKGTHEGHQVVVVEVHVCKDDLDRVYSIHKLQDAGDEALAMAWPSGGQEQVAFALLAEAVRREALLEILVRMTSEPGFPQRYAEMSPEEQQDVVSDMSRRLRSQMNNVVARVAQQAVSETLNSVLSL